VLAESQSDSNKNQAALKARYRRIMRFATAVLVQTWWFELALPSLGLRKISAKGRIKRLSRQARRFHDLAASLGGLMIKLGQYLSSRLDVLPEAITKELEGLQDEVKPENIAEIKLQIAKELGLPVDEAFSWFDEIPIAAASLGQAHRAKLSPLLAELTGFEDIVVKILRPGIEEIVEVDIKALRRVGSIVSRIKLVSRRANAPLLVEEFAETSFQEINYLHEAENLNRFRENFLDDSKVSTPEIVWERTSKRVLTLSDVSAIKITDVDALTAAGIDSNAVAAELARISFQQYFITGFFHADPHPGNIFVKPDHANLGDFTLIFIDFGMMGEITPQVRSDLQRLLIALAARDPKACLEATQRLKFLLPSADEVELERAFTELFDRFGGLSVSDLIKTDPKEVRDLALEYSQILRTLPFQLPENFLLLFRSLSLISGVTSSLNREFNLWDAVDPFAQTLLSQGGGVLRSLANQAVSTVVALAGLPRRIDSLVNRAEKGNLATRAPETEKRIRILGSGLSRLTMAITFSTLLLAGIYLRSRGDELGNYLLGISVIPLVGAIGIASGK